MSPVVLGGLLGAGVGVGLVLVLVALLDRRPSLERRLAPYVRRQAGPAPSASPVLWRAPFVRVGARRLRGGLGGVEVTLSAVVRPAQACRCRRAGGPETS
ncbi:MAG: hypothetical protein FWD18_05250 [Micrococcales bacterium]|nr:hypothetical protein [Micrococcales bacterium]